MYLLLEGMLLCYAREVLLYGLMLCVQPIEPSVLLALYGSITSRNICM
jgi:hypothetical protein